jgi:phosphatidylserine/phosphatidylglycerophosphate/cardiolipin synthase-like enzyme
LVKAFVERWSTHPQSAVLEASGKDKPGKPKLRGLSDVAPTEKKLGDQLVGIIRTVNLITPAGACKKDRSVQTTLIQAIRAARLFIYIEDQYFVHWDAMIELFGALSRIQFLIILIPDSSLVDLPLIYAVGRRVIGNLRKHPKAR